MYYSMYTKQAANEELNEIPLLKISSTFGNFMTKFIDYE